MLKRESIYFLNKDDKDAIVYANANGNITRLTVSDFSSPEEFLRWKNWSDQDFHAEEKGDHIFYNNNNSLEALPDSVATFPSAEVILERKAHNRAHEKYAAEVILGIRERLTDKQFRRVWLYYISGLTEGQIAEMERVAQQNISKSIRQSVNKLKTFLNGHKNRV